MKCYVTLFIAVMMFTGINAQTHSIKKASEVLLIDDFEDGDTLNLKGGQWDIFGAAGSDIKYQVTSTGSYNLSKNSLHITGKWVSYGGAETYMTSSKGDTNLTKFAGISFAAKAGKNTNLSWVRIRERKAEGARGYAYFVYKFTAPAEWKIIEVPFDSLKVQYGDPVPPFDATDIYAIDFAAAAANSDADFYIDNIAFYTGTGTAVESPKGQKMPEEYSLKQNYPNPFNPSTSIQYSLKENGFVTLRVFDIVGREVSQLVNEYKNAGSYKAQFNAKGLPSGFYFCQLSVNGHVFTNKMTLLK